MSDEEWRDIPNWEGLYQASNQGRIRRLESKDCRGNRIAQHMLTPAINKHRGYSYVTLAQNRTSKSYQVHRLIALAFMGPCPSGMQVNHVDGNKTNNAANNLEYVTGKRNVEHARSIGLWSGKGETNNSARLTQEQVNEIRRRRQNGEMPKTLAEHYQVSAAHIWRIVHYRTWRED